MILACRFLALSHFVGKVIGQGQRLTSAHTAGQGMAEGGLLGETEHHPKNHVLWSLPSLPFTCGSRWGHGFHGASGFSTTSASTGRHTELHLLITSQLNVFLTFLQTLGPLRTSYWIVNFGNVHASKTIQGCNTRRISLSQHGLHSGRRDPLA